MWLCVLDTDSSLVDEETNSNVKLCNQISDVTIKTQTLTERRRNQSLRIGRYMFFPYAVH